MEKSAGSSNWSVAATVSTWGRLPGGPAATPSLRSFPEDATRIEPVPKALSSVSSSRRVYGTPKLMLITLGPAAIAALSAAITFATVRPPTSTERSTACG